MPTDRSNDAHQLALRLERAQRLLDQNGPWKDGSDEGAACLEAATWLRSTSAPTAADGRSETPQVDAAEYDTGLGDGEPDMVVPAKIARQLERALASAQREGMLRAAEICDAESNLQAAHSESAGDRSIKMAHRSVSWGMMTVAQRIRAEAEKLAADGGSAKMPETAVPDPIACLRDALDDADIHGSSRAEVVGYFCNAWNRQIAAAPSPGEEQQR